MVRLSTGYLAEHGSSSPRLDAELLAAQALSLQRLDLYLQFDRPLEDTELTSIRELVRRRGCGEPVAYIRGEREFYGRGFAVSSDVLIPRPDTECLVEVVLAWCRAHVGLAPTILDVGTGSGCIAISLAAELPEVTLVASDISAAALDVAASNAGRHQVEARIELRRGIWGEALDHRKFTVIVSNPPYVKPEELEGLDRDVRDFEPHLALTDGAADGLDSYRQLGALAAIHLASPGLLAVEVDPRRATAVSELLQQTLPSATVALCNDLTERPRVVTAELVATGNG